MPDSTGLKNGLPRYGSQRGRQKEAAAQWSSLTIGRLLAVLLP